MASAGSHGSSAKQDSIFVADGNDERNVLERLLIPLLVVWVLNTLDKKINIKW